MRNRPDGCVRLVRRGARGRRQVLRRVRERRGGGCGGTFAAGCRAAAGLGVVRGPGRLSPPFGGARRGGGARASVALLRDLPSAGPGLRGGWAENLLRR